MIDHKLKPKLIEINQMPSFGTDAPIDYKVKKALLLDVAKKLCLNMKRKNQYKKEREKKMQERLLKPNHNIDDKNMNTQQRAEEERKIVAMIKKKEKAEKERLRKERMLEREKNEAAVAPAFELVYPLISYK